MAWTHDTVIKDLRKRLDAVDNRVDTLITDLRNERERADTLQAMNVQTRDRIRELESLTASVQEESEAVGSPGNGASVHTDCSTNVETTDTSMGALARLWEWLRRK